MLNERTIESIETINTVDDQNVYYQVLKSKQNKAVFANIKAGMIPYQ